MNKKTIRDIDVAGKRCLVRVDFNVPLNSDGTIADDTRIKAAIPTIKYLVDNKAKVILVSHLGRPKGGFQPELSLKNISERLADLIGLKVKLLGSSVVGSDVEKDVSEMKESEVVLLENVRFNPGDEKNDKEFAAQLAKLADIFVNDAFGTAHRAHASTAGVAQFLPSVAGFLMEKEIEVMGKAITQPEKPFIAIVGGAKISTKAGVLKNLLNKVDKIILGGGVATTFLKADGREVGKSLVEDNMLQYAKELLAQNRDRIILPIDVVLTESIKNPETASYADIGEIPLDLMIVDVGPKTLKMYGKILSDAKTVVWNGPMGVFEVDKFAAGTIVIASMMAGLNAITIVGGGESVAALNKFGLEKTITLVSTGGGATLEFLEGLELPGVAALENK